MFEQFNTYSEKNGVDFFIDKITLAFKDKSIESEFKESYFKTNLQVSRACHLLAIFFYSLVGMWNAFVVDPSMSVAWAWIVSIVSIVFLLGFLSSYLAPELYARYWQQCFAFYVVMTGSGFTIITILSGSNYTEYNFAGIVFCLFFCYAFIRLTFLWAAAAGNFIAALYVLSIFIFIPIPLKELLTNFFYIFGINLLGMMVCYSLELMSRRDFMLNDLLKRAENKTKNMNVHLEQMVKERTKEIERAYQELKVSIHREQDLVARLENEEKRLQKSLSSLEQAEVISRLGYFERNWQNGELYCSRGAFKLLGLEDTDENLTYEKFLTFVSPKNREQFSDHVQHAVKNREPMDIEFSITQTDESILQIHGMADNFYDNDGRLSFTRGVFQDITERKKSEAALEKLQGQLIQAQKMESIGRLAGGVAHDYNNISGIIIGYTELSMECVRPEDEVYSNLEQILSAAKRATDITRQLLAFARKQTISPQVVDLNEIVESMLKILRRLIGENIDLVWIPGKNIPPVKIDPSQVDQILANICVNSRDAILNIGKITIETKNITFDEKYCADHAGFIPGEFIRLTVSDNGRGMAPETLDKVFEPFFTTKEIGKGTGLGLATVYGIVKQNKGFINVYSEPDEGTTVKVYLPHSSEEIILPPEEEKPVEQPAGKNETILLVEDDASILDFGKRMLESLGYTVFTTNKPVEALEIVSKEKPAGAVQLLITDVVMPEMNGRELAGQLRAVCPDIKTLFMSGYTANVIAHHGVLEEGVNFISKPFSKNELAVKVREVLDNLDH